MSAWIFLKAAGALAALLLACYVVWRLVRPAPAPPRIERVNLDRRVREGMLQELRGSGRKYSAKKLQKELRRQQRNGKGGTA